MATIRRAAALYRTVLGMYKSEKSQDHPKTNSEVMSHILWMAERIPEFLDAGEEGKANRWLGFIQGVLWKQGIYFIDDLRRHNTMNANIEGCCLVCRYCVDVDDVAHASCRIFQKNIGDLTQDGCCPPRCCPLWEKE